MEINKGNGSSSYDFYDHSKYKSGPLPNVNSGNDSKNTASSSVIITRPEIEEVDLTNAYSDDSKIAYERKIKKIETQRALALEKEVDEYQAKIAEDLKPYKISLYNSKKELSELNKIIEINDKIATAEDGLKQIFGNDYAKKIDEFKITSQGDLYKYDAIEKYKNLKKELEAQLAEKGYGSIEDVKTKKTTLIEEIAYKEELINKSEEISSLAMYNILKGTDAYEDFNIDKSNYDTLDEMHNIMQDCYVDGSMGHISFAIAESKYNITPLEFYKALETLKNSGTEFEVNGEKMVYNNYVVHTSDVSNAIHEITVDEFTLLEKLSKLEETCPDLVKMYNYMYTEFGHEEATEYLNKIEDTMNKQLGMIAANEFLEELSTKNGSINMEEAWNAVENHFKVDVQGFKDGTISWYEGMENFFDPSNVMSEEEYKKQYIMQALQSGQYTEGIIGLDRGYEVSQGIGYMAPIMALSAVNPLMGKGALFTSSAGGTVHQDLVSGYSLEESYNHGVVSGLVTIGLEYALGGMPGLSKLGNSRSIIANVGSEVIEEYVENQYVSPLVSNIMLGTDIEITSWNEETWNTIVNSAITAFVFNGSNRTLNIVMDGKQTSMDMETIFKITALTEQGMSLDVAMNTVNNTKIEDLNKSDVSKLEKNEKTYKISKEISTSLMEKINTGTVDFELIIQNPEILNYLKDKDISSCLEEVMINLDENNSVNLYKFLNETSTKDDILNFISEYREVLNKCVIRSLDGSKILNLKDTIKKSDTIEDIKRKINKYYRYLLIREGFEYPNIIPQSLKNDYPTLFLSSDAPEHLKNFLYKRRLPTSDIKKLISSPDPTHQAYVNYLKNIDIEIFWPYMSVSSSEKKETSINLVSAVKKIFGNELGLNIMLSYDPYIRLAYKERGGDKFKFNSNFSKNDLLDELDLNILQTIIAGKMKYNEDMPSHFKNNNPTLFLNQNTSHDVRDKFYNREFTLNDFNSNPDLLEKFGDTNIVCGFSENISWMIPLFNHFDNLKMANLNRLKVISEYSKIQDEALQKDFKEYVMEFGNNIDMEKIEHVSEVLSRLSLSNSSEIFTFRKELATQILNSENPLESLSKIEDIFIKNNVPTVGKTYSCFEILHPDFQGFNFDNDMISPVLKNSSTKSKKIIVFSDLIKASFGSNNKSVNEYLKNIECGSKLYESIKNGNLQYEELNEIEKNQLIDFSKNLATLYNNTLKGKKESEAFLSTGNVLTDILELSQKLSPDGTLDYNLADRVIRMFCGFAGIDTLEQAKDYISKKIQTANIRNRNASSTEIALEQGDFIKGIGNITHLRNILQNGSVSKEYLGSSAGSDATPLDTDVSMVMSSDGTIRDKIGATAAKTYGPIWFVLKNDERFVTTRTNIETLDAKRDMSKMEVFHTGVWGEGHYGIRTGFASSEINYIVMENYDPRVGLEIAMNGFYIPIANMDSEIIFTPEDYDKLREKMSGLSYFDEGSYKFSENLITKETESLASQIEQNNYDVQVKRTKINEIIKKSLNELGLHLKTTIDGDLTEGFVELIDTGSTGRGTNKPGDGDFDFMMRLDKNILSNPTKLSELKQTLLKNLRKNNSSELTGTGDFRLKNVQIDNEINVDIDITFTEKTDKVSYSTDMALQDRLTTIQRTDPEKYKYVVANILLAKQVLKQAEAYKPNRGEIPQGGLGGVGIENWILQNGGSFIDAAKSFIEAADEKTFAEFQNSYQIWDFGENHLAGRRGQYSHDNFVDNMSSSGYQKMRKTLTEYVSKTDSTKVVKRDFFNSIAEVPFGEEIPEYLQKPVNTEVEQKYKSISEVPFGEEIPEYLQKTVNTEVEQKYKSIAEAPIEEKNSELPEISLKNHEQLKELGVLDYLLDLRKFKNQFIKRNYPLTKEDMSAIINEKSTENIAKRKEIDSLIENEIKLIIEEKARENQQFLKDLQENKPVHAQTIEEYKNEIFKYEQRLLEKRWNYIKNSNKQAIISQAKQNINQSVITGETDTEIVVENFEDIRLLSEEVISDKKIKIGNDLYEVNDIKEYLDKVAPTSILLEKKNAFIDDLMNKYNIPKENVLELLKLSVNFSTDYKEIARLLNYSPINTSQLIEQLDNVAYKIDKDFRKFLYDTKISRNNGINAALTEFLNIEHSLSKIKSSKPLTIKQKDFISTFNYCDSAFNFVKNNQIDMYSLSTDPRAILKKEQVSPLLKEYGIQIPEIANISIADIVGYGEEYDGKNILTAVNDYFRDKGDGYHTRSTSMLSYNSDNVISGLSESFKDEPISVKENSDGKYTIHTNGKHRYTLMRILYLNESLNTPESETLNLKEKYTIPVKLYKYDKTKTYCNYILYNYFNDYVSVEYDQYGNVTGKVKLRSNQQALDNNELISCIKGKILKLSNNEITNMIEHSNSEVSEFIKNIIK